MSDAMQIDVGPEGQVVLPARLRRQLGIEEGSRLVALVEGEALVLVPRPAVARQLVSMFADVPDSLSEELLAERRAGAARDAEA